MREERTTNYYTCSNFCLPQRMPILKKPGMNKSRSGIRTVSIIRRHCTARRKPGHN